MNGEEVVVSGWGRGWLRVGKLESWHTQRDTKSQHSFSQLTKWKHATDCVSLAGVLLWIEDFQKLNWGFVSFCLLCHPAEVFSHSGVSMAGLYSARVITVVTAAAIILCKLNKLKDLGKKSFRKSTLRTNGIPFCIKVMCLRFWKSPLNTISLLWCKLRVFLNKSAEDQQTEIILQRQTKNSFNVQKTRCNFPLFFSSCSSSLTQSIYTSWSWTHCHYSNTSIKLW